MKKQLACLTLALLFVFLISSCGSSSDTPSWELGQYGKTVGSSETAEKNAPSESPEASGNPSEGEVSVNENAEYSVMPLPESEGKDGFSFNFDIVGKNGMVTDADIVKIHIRIVNSKNVTVFDADVPVQNKSGNIMTAFVDYSKLTADVNGGTATVSVSGNQLAATGDMTFMLNKLPMNLDNEITVSDKRTANRYTSKGEIETTTTIEKIERQDTVLSKSVTLTFNFTCRRTFGDYGYCGFTVIFSDRNGTELGRKKCFSKVEADGTFQCSAALSNYIAGTGLVVSFADYE